MGFAEIHRIAFELSNRCVHAHEHSLCPAHLKRSDPPANLPRVAVEKVLSSMKENVPAYGGAIYFHNYNEPLADPRLMDFVRRARAVLPRCRIWITTSGWNLDQVLLGELQEAGVNDVKVSVYSPEAMARVRALRPPAGLKLRHKPGVPSSWRQVLRPEYIRVYDEGPTYSGRCKQPYKELTIAHTGDVALCCADWKRTVTFGNVLILPFAEIIQSDKMAHAAASLKAGRRIFKVCTRCAHAD